MGKGQKKNTVLSVVILGVSLASTSALANPGGEKCEDRLKLRLGGFKITNTNLTPDRQFDSVDLYRKICEKNPSEEEIKCLTANSFSNQSSQPLNADDRAASILVRADLCHRHPTASTGHCFDYIEGQKTPVQPTPGKITRFGAHYADQFCTLSARIGTKTSEALKCISDKDLKDVDLSVLIQLCVSDPDPAARECFAELKKEGHAEWSAAKLCGARQQRELARMCLKNLKKDNVPLPIAADFCMRSPSPVAQACLTHALAIGVPGYHAVEECIRNPNQPNFSLSLIEAGKSCLSNRSTTGEIPSGTTASNAGASGSPNATSASQ